MGEINYEPLIRDMTWSYSRIKTFYDCPYRWFLKYILFPTAVRKPMFFSDYGIFMHELIAAFYKDEQSSRELQFRYLSEFRNRVRGVAPSSKVFATYFPEGLKHIENLRKSNAKILSVETKSEFLVSGIPFVGYTDLVSESPDGFLLLTDHKSRNLRPRSHRASPTKSDIELDSYLTQLYLYSAAIKSLYGRFPDRLRFNCFRKDVLIDEPFDYVNFQKAIDWLLVRIEDICLETEFNPNMEWFKCRYLCEMQDHCEYYELSRK